MGKKYCLLIAETVEAWINRLGKECHGICNGYCDNEIIYSKYSLDQPYCRCRGSFTGNLKNLTVPT